MLLQNIRLTNIRNLYGTQLCLHPKINVFVGSNGSGKTSILEAIYFLATGRSFRTSKINNLINYNNQFVAINANGSDSSQQRIAKFSVLKHIQQDKINKIGDTLAATSQIASLLPVQIINDSISNIIFKEPEGRRKLLDWLVFYAKGNYHTLWKSFNKSLQQRNKLLKQPLLDFIKVLDQADQIFFDLAMRVAQARQIVWEQFLPVWEEMMVNLGVEHGIRPQTSLVHGWQGNLLEQLAANRRYDLKLGSTHVGPHKADLNLSINNRPAKELLSRGQGKMLSLSLILARAQFITQIAEREDFVSILLIDDLHSELDHENAKKIIDLMLGLTEHVQFFITGVDKDTLINIVPTERASWFLVDNGTINPIER